MPQLSPLEILVVSAIALIVFGPEKLPQIARTIGRGISELRRMASDVKQEFEVGLDIDDDDDDEDDRPRVHRPTRRNSGASADGEGGTGLSKPDTEGNEGAAPGARADPNDPPPTEAP